MNLMMDKIVVQDEVTKYWAGLGLGLLMAAIWGIAVKGRDVESRVALSLAGNKQL